MSVLGLCTRIRDMAFKIREHGLQALAHGVPSRHRSRGGGAEGSFLLPEDTSKEYVFIADGIGITVVRCMLR